MSKRKSPYRHHVKNHVRSNRPVRDYDRGSGDKPLDRRSRRHRVVGETMEEVTGEEMGLIGPYTVTIDYVEAPSEVIVQSAPDYGAAIDPALERRTSIMVPRRVTLRGVE